MLKPFSWPWFCLLVLTQPKSSALTACLGAYRTAERVQGLLTSKMTFVWPLLGNAYSYLRVIKLSSVAFLKLCWFWSIYLPWKLKKISGCKQGLKILRYSIRRSKARHVSMYQNKYEIWFLQSPSHATIGKDKIEVSEEDLRKLPFIKWCTLEAIRLRSPGAITKKVVNPIRIQVSFFFFLSFFSPQRMLSGKWP